MGEQMPQEHASKSAGACWNCPDALQGLPCCDCIACRSRKMSVAVGRQHQLQAAASDRFLAWFRSHQDD